MLYIANVVESFMHYQIDVSLTRLLHIGPQSGFKNRCFFNHIDSYQRWRINDRLNPVTCMRLRLFSGTLFNVAADCMPGNGYNLYVSQHVRYPWGPDLDDLTRRYLLTRDYMYYGESTEAYYDLHGWHKVCPIIRHMTLMKIVT